MSAQSVEEDSILIIPNPDEEEKILRVKLEEDPDGEEGSSISWNHLPDLTRRFSGSASGNLDTRIHQDLERR